MTIDWELIDMYGTYFLERREQFPNEAPSFRPFSFGLADQWLESLVKLFLSAPKDYLSQHRKLILEMVKKIRGKKTYLFLYALKAVERRFELPFPLYMYELKETPPRTTLSSFLMTELLLVWALMEKDGKLLIRVRDGFERKRFPLPDDQYNRRRAITAIGHHILAVLPFIELRHLDLIPDSFRPLLEGVDPSIELPIFDRTIEEVLTDARVRRRYTVHPEGMMVQWKKRSADLKEMFVKVIDGVAIAKVTTSVGGTLAFLNLKTAQGLDFVIHKEGPQNPLALDLAAAYHKLVTAKEIKAGRETELGIPTVQVGTEKPELVGEGPTVIYIPRTIVVQKGGAGKVRKVLPRQPIHHESPRDHARYLKGRGEMSAEQRRRVEEFDRERENGDKILDWLQPGWTYVLPHDWREKKRRVIYLATTIEPQLSLKVSQKAI